MSHTLQYFRAWHGRLGHWSPSAAKLRLFFEKLRRLAEPGAKATELVTLPMLEDSGESPALSASSPEVPMGLSILCSSARAASASNLVAQRASLDCTTVPSSRSAEACRTASTQRCGEWMRCQPSALWCCGTAWRLLKAFCCQSRALAVKAITADRFVTLCHTLHTRNYTSAPREHT